MTALVEYLRQELQEHGCKIGSHEGGEGLSFNIHLAGRDRFSVLTSDGHAQVDLLFFLRSQDMLGKRGARRLRTTIDAIAEKEPFGGQLLSHRHILWWKVTSLFPSEGKAVKEVLQYMLVYGRDDLGRLDLVQGLVSAKHFHSRWVRRTDAMLGMVEGSA